MASLQTGSVWQQPGLDANRFEAYANLLCLQNGGQVEEASRYAEPHLGDDDDDDGDEPSNQLGISSVKAATVSRFGHDKTKRAFLDRLSELVSGEKGDKQVACCLLLEWPDHADVLVAKNNAFKDDEACVRMLQELATQLVELSKRDTLDLSWDIKGQQRLWNTVLQLSRARILYYTSTVFSMLDTINLAQLSGADRALAAAFEQFRSLASHAAYLDTPRGWHEAVAIASRIRTQGAGLDRIRNLRNAEKLEAALGFLSRPRTCYNTLVRAAQRIPSFGGLRILPVLATCFGGSEASRKKKGPSPAKAWSASKVFESLGLPLNDSTAERVLGNGNAVKRPFWTKNKLIQRYDAYKPPPAQVHAEVQILLAAQRHNRVGAQITLYIGCSKHSCLLCAEFVKAYGPEIDQASGPFVTRGCHGKLYSRWTMPSVSWMTDLERDSLARSLCRVERALKKRLLNRDGPDRALLLAPESTIGGSSVATAKMQQPMQGSVARLIEQHLTNQRQDSLASWSQRNDGSSRDTFITDPS